MVQTKEGYRQTEIGVLPKDWEVSNLGELTDKIVGGGTPSRANKKFWGNEIPWVTVKDFTSYNPYFSEEYITYEGLRNSSSNLIPKNTLITPTRIGLGKAKIYLVDVAINQDLKALFLNKLVFQKYLYYWFEKNEEFIIGRGNGSTVLGISLDELRSFQIPLPPLSEQEKIAEALSDCDAWIESIEQQIAKKKLLKQGAMQQLLSPPANAEALEAWEVYSFVDVFIKVPSKNYQINSNKYKDFGSFKIIDQGKSKVIGFSDLENKVFKNENGVIIFGDHTRIFKFVDFDFIVGADGTQILKCKQDFDLKFLYYLFLNKEVPNTGYNRHFKFLLDMDFVIPNLSEQRRISGILSDMDSEIESLEATLQKARHIKQGMMQDLLTGRVRF